MEGVGSIIVLVFALATPGALFLLPAWWRARDRARLLQLASEAAERGQKLTAEEIRALPGARDWRPQTQKDLRRGVMGVAAGLCFMFLGFLFWSLVQGFDPAMGAAIGFILAGIGAIPLAHGLALLVLSRLGRDEPL